MLQNKLHVFCCPFFRTLRQAMGGSDLAQGREATQQRFIWGRLVCRQSRGYVTKHPFRGPPDVTEHPSSELPGDTTEHTFHGPLRDKTKLPFRGPSDVTEHPFGELPGDTTEHTFHGPLRAKTKHPFGGPPGDGAEHQEPMTT